MNETDLSEGMDLASEDLDATVGGSVEQAEGAAKRCVLAGIGAVATAYDTAEDTFDRLVNRGQQVRDDWGERGENMRRQNAGARARARDYLRGAMDNFLNGLNIPSKGDVDTINVKLNILTRKLDDLQMDVSHESGPRAPEVALSESAVQDPESDLAT